MGKITDLTLEQKESLGKLREQVPAAMEGFSAFMGGVEKPPVPLTARQRS